MWKSTSTFSGLYQAKLAPRNRATDITNIHYSGLYQVPMAGEVSTSGPAKVESNTNSNGHVFDMDPLDRGIGDAKAVRSNSNGHVFDMDPLDRGKLINSTEFSAVDEWASLY